MFLIRPVCLISCFWGFLKASVPDRAGVSDHLFLVGGSFKTNVPEGRCACLLNNKCLYSSDKTVHP